MSAVIVRDYSVPVKAEIPFPLSQPTEEVSLRIIIPDFDFSLFIPLTSITSEIESGKVALQAAVDANVIATLILTGGLIEARAKFRLERVSLNVELTKQSARAEFVASTLIPMLALAQEVHLQIPDVQFEQKLKFDLPLREISHWLQRRQVAYRLMVIEQATGVEFVLPPSFSAEETETIAYLYHAITDRSFVWPVEAITADVPASKQMLDQLPSGDQPTSQRLGPVPSAKTFLGHSITLGNETVEIDDTIIEHVDEVRRELAQNDGHLVKVVVRSLSGQARVKLPEAPRLPEAPWDSKIQALIDLEPQLDARLAERYHALAAATLADLTEEEKAPLTARPELGEEAFSMSDLDGE